MRRQLVRSRSGWYQPLGRRGTSVKKDALPATELEAALLLFGLGGGRRPGDLLGQLLDAAGDGALRVGQDQDLAPDRGLVRLGAVEVDLDGEVLLQGPDDVLSAHHRLRHLVVEGEDDAAWNDVEHIGEDVE